MDEHEIITPWATTALDSCRQYSLKINYLTYIGMLTPGATELFGGGRMPP